MHLTTRLLTNASLSAYVLKTLLVSNKCGCNYTNAVVKSERHVRFRGNESQTRVMKMIKSS